MATERRLIDADVFKQNLVVSTFGFTDIVHVNIALEKATVDAVEVVHGRWLNAQVETGDPFGYDTWEVDVFSCSVCGVHFDVSECRNYCPNCGAKMDGKNENP